MHRACVTIDTEVDKSGDWSIADPPTFWSVTEAIPRLLQPVFRRFGAVPTYLLSPEVIRDSNASYILERLGDEVELGTHLHSEFVPPEQSMQEPVGGRRTSDMQIAHPPKIERGKIEAITDLFAKRFGRRPTAFRAGRFAARGFTAKILGELGYQVDSSVTPYTCWFTRPVRVDHSDAPILPYHPDERDIARPGDLPIWEIPVTVSLLGEEARSAMERLARALPGRLGGAVHRRLPLPKRYWLRPSYHDGPTLCRVADYVLERSRGEFTLVIFAHSNEFVAGASPYAKYSADAAELAARLEMLLGHLAGKGVRMCGLSEAARALDG